MFCRDEALQDSTEAAAPHPARVASVIRRLRTTFMTTMFAIHKCTPLLVALFNYIYLKLKNIQDAFWNHQQQKFETGFRGLPSACLGADTFWVARVAATSCPAWATCFLDRGRCDRAQTVIDLHCHILPGIDDGATDRAAALDMARAFVADGVTAVACTPHILPGLYHNSGPAIRAAVTDLQRDLDDSAVALKLYCGADNHVVPDFVQGLRSGRLLSIADTRYVLVEPPHHVAPPRLEELFFDIVVAGYVPILTHPERLTWIRTHYEIMKRLVGGGVWMQLTAGSLTGMFGRQPKYWAERMLDEGCVHILASDAHDIRKRPPNLRLGRELAAKRIGDAAASALVMTRPAAILANAAPETVPGPSPSLVSAHSGAADIDRDGTTGGVKSSRADDKSRSMIGRLRRLFQ